MANIEKRISQDGKISYRVKVRIKGFPAQSATFERLTDARVWAEQTQSAIREGKYFHTTEAKRHTLAEAIDRYIQFVLPTKPRSAPNQRGQLVWWRQQLGQYSLAEVNPALIAECRDKLIQGKTKQSESRAASTVNRYLAILSHLFTIAIREWMWLQGNPVSRVTKMKEPRGRDRYLSDDERARLLDACKASRNRYLYIIVVLALSTGARRMEILGLQWKHVDLERGVITLEDTKNGDKRVLPVAGHALELMRHHAKIRNLHCNFVFPHKSFKKPMRLSSAWDLAIKRANIEDFKFHDLRHSAASYLAMNGASLAEIAEILGHRSFDMVKKYSHLSEAHVSKVVARMNEKIFGV